MSITTALNSFPKNYDQLLIKSQERLTKGGIYDITLFNIPTKPQYILLDLKR
jgi:hypothetical protein